jgi:hypothetical protein
VGSAKLKNGAGDGTRTRDVQPGKTDVVRFLNIMEFPETYRTAPRFQSFQPRLPQWSHKGVRGVDMYATIWSRAFARTIRMANDCRPVALRIPSASSFF